MWCKRTLHAIFPMGMDAILEANYIEKIFKISYI